MTDPPVQSATRLLEESLITCQGKPVGTAACRDGAPAFAGSGPPRANWRPAACSMTRPCRPLSPTIRSCNEESAALQEAGGSGAKYRW